MMISFKAIDETWLPIEHHQYLIPFMSVFR